MQCLSHGTRAYIVNEDGLAGFVLKFDVDIIPFLKKADKAGQLEHAKKYQLIDLNTLESKLENFTSNGEEIVEGKSVSLTPFQQKIDYMSKAYPRLFIFILDQFGMKDRIEKFLAKCKAYEDDRYKYSLYVHGYLLVWLDQQRQEGKLALGM